MGFSLVLLPSNYRELSRERRVRCGSSASLPAGSRELLRNLCPQWGMLWRPQGRAGSRDSSRAGSGAGSGAVLFPACVQQVRQPQRRFVSPRVTLS